MRKRLVPAFAAPQEKTVRDTLIAYEEYLTKVKGNKPRSIEHAMIALRRFVGRGSLGLSIARLTPAWGAERYQALVAEGLSVDSHRNYLAAARTWLAWCIEAPRRWLVKHPLDAVRGEGRRKHGKDQLRVDEARRWQNAAYVLAEEGDDGAVAALMALEMGLRASEVTARIVRDVDDGGRILWIEGGKTAGSNGAVRVPVRLQPHLRALCEAKTPLAPLFRAERGGTGHHDRDWVRDQVHRICDLAKVPRVTAHGMRGLRATLDLLAGRELREASEGLRHASAATTLQSYVGPEGHAELEQRRTDRVLRVLNGGRR